MTMKKHAGLLLMMLVGLMTMVNAQSSNIVKARIPFDFTANGKKMPAGECIIAVVVSNGRTFLSISGGTQHVYALPNADKSGNASQETVLVFHRYGDQYFLTGMKREGKIGYQLPATRLEGELQAGNVAEHVFTLLASAK